MKLCSPSGVWPAKSVANQLTMTARTTTMPQSDSQIRCGITRMSRNEHRQAGALQVVRELESDGMRPWRGTAKPDARAARQARPGCGIAARGRRAAAPPRRTRRPGAHRRRVVRGVCLLHHRASIGGWPRPARGEILARGCNRWVSRGDGTARVGAARGARIRSRPSAARPRAPAQRPSRPPAARRRRCVASAAWPRPPRRRPRCPTSRSIRATAAATPARSGICRRER